MRGAGGTNGGTSRFFVGLVMLVSGLYIFLKSVHVNFHLGSRIYQYQDYDVTTGMIFIPFMIGVGLIFYNSRSLAGWVVTVLSLAFMVMGIILNTRLTLAHMDAFQLMLILVLMVGGLGLFLSSFRSYS